MKKLLIFLLAVALLLCGCGAPGGNETTQTPENTRETPSGSMDTLTGTEALDSLDPESLFSGRDYEVGYDEAKSGLITLEGGTIRSSSDAVQISGTTAVITDEGTYVIRGTLNNGMILVNAAKEDKVQLVLDGVSVTSETCAAIYVAQADKVFITLVGENVLANGGSFEAIDDSNPDAVIFSKEDLTMNGTGSLTITSPAGHGVVSKDELTVTGGTYSVSCASHGFCGKDSVAIADADMTIVSGKDGIHGENDEEEAMGFVYIRGGSFTITAEGDGIASSSLMQIDGGTFQLRCGGGAENGEQHTNTGFGGMGGMGGRPGGGGPGGNREQSSGGTAEDTVSTKGIKAGSHLLINGGTFGIDSADDAIHSNGDLTIAGGSFEIATGDDGFHSDEALEILQGVITVTESYEGLEGLSIRILGGEIDLTAGDDGLNAAGGMDQSGFGGFGGMGGRPGDRFGGSGSSDSFIEISGGNLFIRASGDGIDSNGTLTISGGFTTVCGPTQGDTAVLDYDSTGVITGGIFIGTGSYMMAQSFSDSKQGVIALSVGNQASGTRITLSDRDGKLLADHSPELNYAILIISTPEMVKGETYTVTVGQLSGDFEAS